MHALNVPIRRTSDDANLRRASFGEMGKNMLLLESLQFVLALSQYMYYEALTYES